MHTLSLIRWVSNNYPYIFVLSCRVSVVVNIIKMECETKFPPKQKQNGNIVNEMGPLPMSVLNVHSAKITFHQYM